MVLVCFGLNYSGGPAAAGPRARLGAAPAHGVPQAGAAPLLPRGGGANFCRRAGCGVWLWFKGNPPSASPPNMYIYIYIYVYV